MYFQYFMFSNSTFAIIEFQLLCLIYNVRQVLINVPIRYEVDHKIVFLQECSLIKNKSFNSLLH